MKELINFSLMVFLAYFGVAYFHGHYMIWLIFMATLGYYYNKKILPSLLVICATFPIILLTWDEMPLYRLTGLFTPIAPDFFLNVITPSQIINRFFPIALLINLARSALGGACLYLIWQLLKSDNGKIKEK